jgi:uncharacterized protein YcbK (DUF882 family)
LAASDSIPYPEQWRDSRAIVLAGEFEAIREVWGRPIRITSAYRTPETNVKAKGKKNSQHLYGRALDLKAPAGINFQVFYNKVLTLAKERGIIRGVGLNMKNRHVHIDTRPSDVLVTWDE